MKKLLYLCTFFENKCVTNRYIAMKEDNAIDKLVPMLQNPATRNKAMAELMRLTKHTLYWHIRKMVLVHEDADDVLQNTYIKIWKSVESFKGESQFYTWMYRIATNEALTFMAQQRMQNVQVPMDYEDLMIERMEADAYYDGDAMQTKFQKAIMTLPEKQRLVFNMRYFEDKSYAEIAEITGTSEGALKASYHIAAEKITAYIKNQDD